jgi:hypothetical protein
LTNLHFMKEVKVVLFSLITLLLAIPFQSAAQVVEKDSLHIYKYEYVRKSIPEGERLVVWYRTNAGQEKIRGKLGEVGENFFYLDGQKIMISQVNSLRIDRPFQNFIGIGAEITSGGTLALIGLSAIGAIFQSDNTGLGLAILALVAIPVAAVFGLSQLIKTKRFKFNKEKWTLHLPPPESS